MEQVIHFFQGEMEVPGLISWFHLISLLIIIAVTFLISFFFKDAEEKVYKRILFIFWILLVILEIMKQIIKPFHYGSPSYWEYDPYDFPFHLCSMILYFLPILIFIKKEKCPAFIDAVNGFVSTIVLFAGLAVAVYNEMVMSRLIFTNIQTMVHHGTQIVVGVYVYVWNRRTINIKSYLNGMKIFTVVASIAMIINTAFYPRGIDMFFLNPTQTTTLPLVGVIQEKAGFFVYLIGYLAVVFSLAFLIHFVETSIYKLTLKKQK